MHAAARATAAYQSTQVQSCSPMEQIVLLYDTAIQALTKVRDAMAKRDLPTRHRGISHTLAIINHLQSTLDLSAGGDIARQLDALYTYLRERIIDANMRHRVEPIEESLQLLGTLREGWAQAAATPAGPVPVQRGQE